MIKSRRRRTDFNSARFFPVSYDLLVLSLYCILLYRLSIQILLSSLTFLLLASAERWSSYRSSSIEGGPKLSIAVSYTHIDPSRRPTVIVAWILVRPIWTPYYWSLPTQRDKGTNTNCILPSSFGPFTIDPTDSLLIFDQPTVHHNLCDHVTA